MGSTWSAEGVPRAVWLRSGDEGLTRMIHYSPHKWLDHLFDIEGSMAREIVGRVTACVLWAVVVVVVHKYAHPLGIAPLMHTLVGVAMGLLLVFRTNSSYDRYWEGRRQWGGVTNDSRNLGRSARLLLKDDPGLLAEVLAWTAAFPYALMHRLRGTPAALPASLGLPAGAVAAVVSADHVPMAVALRIGRSLETARSRGLISDYLYGTLDACVQRLVDELGACERIHSTPLPFVYVVHLRRALIFYCFTIPFALLDAYGWGTILATLLVSYLFFGIEEIGVEIEDPFGSDANDLALETYCQRIEAYLQSLCDEAPDFSNPVVDAAHAV